jgi:hypothetical protein
MRRPIAAVALAGIVVAVGYVYVALTSECGAGASCPATAEVNGKTYLVGVVRGLSVTDDALSPYGRIAKTNTPGQFADDAVFTIRDVDPTTLLLVRATPNARDDMGAIGPFMGLWGEGQDPDVCRYFVRLGPTWCESAPGSSRVEPGTS